MRRLALMFMLGMAVIATAGQNQPLGFEAASIKPSQSAQAKTALPSVRGNRVTARNVSLGLLIRTAYGLQDFQLAGAIDWIESDHFDLDARATTDGPFAPGQMLRMMRTLLAERFKLALHEDTKVSPIFALVTTRSGGKVGPGMRSVETGAAGALRAGPGRITSKGTTVAGLANALIPYVGRTVVDKTGLAGNFEFELQYTPTQEQLPQRLAGADMTAVLSQAGVDLHGPSLFTALEEQLGLKLEAARAPIKVLIIDHAEKPDEN